MIRTTFLKACTAFLLLLGVSTLAWAQRGADEGQYNILQASYGTAERHVDVTPRLRELARMDEAFRVTNDNFGTDPHPQRVKTLRIYARGLDGRTRIFDYAEDSIVDGARFTGWVSGNWGQGGWNGGWGDAGNASGQSPAQTPGDDGQYQILQANYGTAERHVDVTRRLKELARTDRTFRTSNDTLGVDPHPGRVKTLRIYARGRDGREHTFEYAEDSIVDGARFTGWSGGNWGQGGWRGGWGDAQQGSGIGQGNGRLHILSATYGAGNRQFDVAARLRARVQNDQLDVQVDNEMAGGDPAPQTLKSLWIVYTLGSGREQRVRISENQRLRLP